MAPNRLALVCLVVVLPSVAVSTALVLLLKYMYNALLSFESSIRNIIAKQNKNNKIIAIKLKNLLFVSFGNFYLL